jgi:hypothetical protein
MSKLYDRRPVRRGLSAAVLVVGGGALTAAVWASGQHGLAVASGVFYAVAAGLAWWWAGGRGDVAAVLRADGDERQRGIDRDATALTGLAMSVAAIVGAVVETARTGQPGAYGVLCLVGGASYVVALTTLRARR